MRNNVAGSLRSMTPDPQAAYCLMTNHIHILATPQEKASFAVCIESVHAAVAVSTGVLSVGSEAGFTAAAIASLNKGTHPCAVHLPVRTPPLAGTLNRITQSRRCVYISVAGLPADRKQGTMFPRRGNRGRAFNVVNTCVYDTRVYGIVRRPSCKS